MARELPAQKSNIATFVVGRGVMRRAWTTVWVAMIAVVVYGLTLLLTRRFFPGTFEGWTQFTAPFVDIMASLVPAIDIIRQQVFPDGEGFHAAMMAHMLAAGWSITLAAVAFMVPVFAAVPAAEWAQETERIGGPKRRIWGAVGSLAIVILLLGLVFLGWGIAGACRRPLYRGDLGFLMLTVFLGGQSIFLCALMGHVTALLRARRSG